MSYQTRVTYVVTGGQREFDLAIPYIDKTHIKVTLNGSFTAFEWISDSRIRLTYLPVENSTLKVRRETPISAALVEFQNGATLTKEELNTAVRQLLYRLQEQDDFLNDNLDRAIVRLGDHLGVVTTPEAIMDELLRTSELGDDLLNRFRDALASIDLSAQRILDQSFALADQAFKTDTLDGIIANTTARTEGLENRVESLTGLVDALANLEGDTGLATIIQNEATARIAGDTALTATLALIGAKNGANNAFVLNLDTTRVGPTESLGQRLTAITAKANDNAAKILTEATTRADAISAQADRIDLLVTRANGFDASITTEQTARANGEARNLAQEHRNHAGTSEANARYWAELAQSKGEGSSADRAVVEQLAEEVADNAAMAVQDAQDAAASAALAATFDPNLFDKKSDTLSATRLVDMIDPARIPVLVGQTPIVSTGGIANLTAQQQTGVMPGTLVATTDGRRWVYSGTGSKTVEASYIEQGDVTPIWDVIANKPNHFPTNIVNVAGLQSALDAKSAVGHAHSWADITEKPVTFVPDVHAHPWSEITGKPTTFTPSSHGHAWSDINGFVGQDYKGRIPSGANLDTYSTTGLWTQHNNANAAAGSNYPVAEAGLLEVTTDASGIIWQRYTSYRNNRSWWRTYNGAAWTAWAEVEKIGHTHPIANVSGLQAALDAKVTSGSAATLANLSINTGLFYADGSHTVIKTGPGGAERYWRFDANGFLYSLNGGLYANQHIQTMTQLKVGASTDASRAEINKGWAELRNTSGPYIDLSKDGAADFHARIHYQTDNFFVLTANGARWITTPQGRLTAISADGNQDGNVLTTHGTEQVASKQITFPSTMNPQDSGASAMLEVQGQGGGYGAWMKFHRPGQYGTYFGMAGAGEFYFGGWSTGGTLYKFWTQANLSPLRNNTDLWNASSEGNERFYFATHGRSYYRSRDGHEWRGNADQRNAHLDNAGFFEAVGGLSTLGNALKIRGNSPTIYFKDTDSRSAMVHVNGNRFYVLRGTGNDTETWESLPGGWPMEINLENNEALFGGTIYSAGSVYSGSGHWFRVRGASGIYWEDYGGGFHMSDATWVRVYNNKNLYCSAQIRGNTVVGESDIRLKENVAPITDATAKVEALAGVTFDWKATGTAGMGFIAQDFETVLPTLVTANEDGMKGVEYGPVVALLVEALKETNARVAALESGRV